MKSFIKRIAIVVTVVVAISTGVPLIIMLIDGAVNKEESLVAELWNMLTEG